MSTVDEWLNEPPIGLYSTMFTLGSLIRFRSCSLVIRNNFLLMVACKRGNLAKSISMVPWLSVCFIIQNKPLNPQLLPIPAAIVCTSLSTFNGGGSLYVWVSVPLTNLSLSCAFYPFDRSFNHVFTVVLHLFLFLLYCWQPFLVAGEECFIILACERIHPPSFVPYLTHHCSHSTHATLSADKNNITLFSSGNKISLIHSVRSGNFEKQKWICKLFTQCVKRLYLSIFCIIDQCLLFKL